MHKNTYGQLWQYYINSYESTDKLVKESGEEKSAGKTGHFFNLMSVMLEWRFLGKRQAGCYLERKRKSLQDYIK